LKSSNQSIDTFKENVSELKGSIRSLEEKEMLK